jgi:D-alanyl-lipoteichoic acid acyltransferase DltB (MBOAT superfamily)
MAINTLSFLLFFVVVFVLYYLPIRLRKEGLWQNIVLLVSSYFFFGYADWRMLPLLVGITMAYYFIGIGLEKKLDTKAGDWLLTLAVVMGVGVLGYFKYLNFCILAFSDLLQAIGFNVSLHTLKIIMPIGISFFIFRLLSYSIEIHRGMMNASRDFLAFASYVAFFPSMLSGPIDRPDKMLPQLAKNKVFDAATATTGMRQILWGMFKKMAVADTLAVFVDANLAADQISSVHSLTMILVIFAYTFQIYADFSGYSDMAIGVGKLLNIKMAVNFKYPLFALNIQDFWNRWHISLTSWMQDYVFLPLSFAFRGWRKWGTFLAVIINFVIVGVWHGAGWNYAIYGLYHGCLFIPLILSGGVTSNTTIRTNKIGLPVLADLCKMLLTFLCVSFGMMIFRSATMASFGEIIAQVGRNWNGAIEFGSAIGWLLVIGMMVVEWLQRKREFGLELSGIKSRAVRWSIYLLIMLLIFYLGGGEQHFIYQVF